MANLEFKLIIYFVYGLTFFVMGLVILLESWRLDPGAPQKKIFRPLALFGFLHGIHEWIEIIFIILKRLGEPVTPVLNIVRLSLLAGSFIALLVYSILAYRFAQYHISVLTVFSMITLPLFAILASIDVIIAYQAGVISVDRVIDSLIRYLLGVPGAAIASISLVAAAKKARADSRRPVDIYLMVTAFGFGLYSITQLFVAPMNTTLASFLNIDVFQALTYVPIPVFRTFVAIVITAGMFLGTRFLEIEQQQVIVAAQKARVEALEQQEMMRRDLLRHIVAAQEEERTRIARELHDEMAQTLTAFSLDLATLQKGIGTRSKHFPVISRLQVLSRQMSQGMHRLVYGLRPAHLDDLGLVAALRFLADQSQEQFNVSVNLAVLGEPRRLNPFLETVIYRIAQEALTNIVRHAQTDKAHIGLEFMPDAIGLEIFDRGVGFDQELTFSAPQGWGLAGMKERAESVNGKLMIESKLGAGTTIRVQFPGLTE